MWRVAALSAPDAGYVALGLGACVLNGLVMPASALCFVEMVAVFYDTDDTKMAAGATRLAVGFLVIAGGAALSNLGQCATFALLGEHDAAAARGRVPQGAPPADRLVRRA